MNRISVLIDGFNLYHSIRDIENETGNKLKWLDISSLCNSFPPLISPPSNIVFIHYFTAYATHLHDKNIIRRHKDYVKCLKNTGINVELGRFKKKKVFCSNCHTHFIRHEEKETDVRIAIKVCDLLTNNQCDSIVLVTGDSDLAPSVKHCQVAFPGKNIVFAFPYKRALSELSKLAPGSFKLSIKNYSSNQFSDPYTLTNGTMINKPSTW